MYGEVIEPFGVFMTHQQAVDGKVAGVNILLGRFRINHTVRVAAVAVAHIRAECGGFGLAPITRNQDYPELRANGDALRKKCHRLLRRRIGCYIIVSRLTAQEQVANASAHEQRLITTAPERVTDRVGHFAWRHDVIMRQTEPRREIDVLESCRERLFGAKDEASDVVGLAGGGPQLIDALHQELKGLLRIPIRQIANGAEPTLGAEFFSRLVESADHAIREENET